MSILAALVLFAQTSIGVVDGVVTDCTSGPEQFAYNATVTADGNGVEARTDLNGKFSLPLPPGTYTVVATDANGSTIRNYVQVDAGETIDIGTLDIGGGVMGCFIEPVDAGAG